MLRNIQNALENLGLSAKKRALHIQFSNVVLNQLLYLQRIDGKHALNQGLDAELLCLSTDATISLKQFVGSQVAVDNVTDRGQFFRCSGIVTGAQQGQSDGALTVYKLQLQDPTALWKHRRNSRVFMSKSVIEIIEIIFKEWQQKSPVFAASLSLDLSGLQLDYDVRPFVMQHNETDDEFLKRLMRQEGINFLIDEAQLVVDHPLAQIEPQKLRLIDDSSQFQALERRNIYFQRSSATERQDNINSFVAQRCLQPTAVHIQRWQADALEQEDGAGSVLSHHQHSDKQDNSSLNLEQAWHFSPAWMQDLKGEDQVSASGNAQVERFNRNLSTYYESEAKQFMARSSVRDAQVGYWFALNGHPEIDLHSATDREFLITSKTFFHQNNLPKDLNDQVVALLTQSHWPIHDLSQQAERQANLLTLQRRTIATVPAYHPLQHRPIAHPQRAKVVGPAGEEIHVDEWGRIKVRFLFTRDEDHRHDGGAGSNDNDTDSAWVDVLTPWAGEGYGVRFLPRIGEIVVIDFFDGNIDRPFVLGRIHEGSRNPTQFDGKAKLPETKKLSGIRSKEVHGEGFGQLRFDDSTGQISSQLQSSHGASQLNLGKLSQPKESEKSDDRGEGFELRTDQWGAIRAGEGLLISTYKQDQAQGEHLHAEPAKTQLESSQQRVKALSDVAKNQQTDEIESVEQLQQLAAQIEGSVARFNKAILLLTSPEAIALSSQDHIYLSADGKIHQCAGDSINLSTQHNLIAQALERISLFAAQNGMKLVAAKGPVEIHAHDGVMDLIARSKIQIMSTEDKVELMARKKILLTVNASQIELGPDGVRICSH